MANQPNFKYFSYTDGAGTVWNKRGLFDAAQNAIDGSTAFTPGAPVWIDRLPHTSTRKAVYADPTTHRTRRFTVYTPAAFATIDGTTPPTLAVSVQGDAAAITYDLSATLPEKKRKAKTSSNLADAT